MEKRINGLIVKDNVVVGVEDKNITEAVIPNGVTSIDKGTFLGCT